MRALGLDIGSKRIGVALSDPDMKVASPLAVLEAGPLRADLRPLLRLIEEWEIDRVVVGLPLTMAGEEGPQALDVRATAEAFAARLPVPLAYHDERLSSAEANKVMAEAGLTEKDRRGVVDKVAATIILQSWLDGLNRESNGSDRPDE